VKWTEVHSHQELVGQAVDMSLLNCRTCSRPRTLQYLAADSPLSPSPLLYTNKDPSTSIN